MSTGPRSGNVTLLLGRARDAAKRRGERVGLTAVDADLSSAPALDDLLTIDAALDDLSDVNPRMVRVVECRYFGGLTIPDTAEALGVSHATVSEDWRFARAWLRRALDDAPWRAENGA